MRRTFRLFLVCLLILALPAQGVSAAVMALQMSESPAQASHAGMESCHAHLQAANNSAADHAAHGSPVKAKACSSCCSGAILSSSEAPALSAPLGRDAYRSIASPAPKGHIPDGLERPPRAVS
jgi:hypothetical protein